MGILVLVVVGMVGDAIRRVRKHHLSTLIPKRGEELLGRRKADLNLGVAHPETLPTASEGVANPLHACVRLLLPKGLLHWTGSGRARHVPNPEATARQQGTSGGSCLTYYVEFGFWKGRV